MKEVTEFFQYIANRRNIQLRESPIKILIQCTCLQIIYHLPPILMETAATRGGSTCLKMENDARYEQPF